MLERVLRNTLGKAGWHVRRGDHQQLIVGVHDEYGFWRPDVLRVDAWPDGAGVILQVRAPGQRAYEEKHPGELAAGKRVRALYAHAAKRGNPPLLAMGVGALPAGLLNPGDPFFGSDRRGKGSNKGGPGEEGEGPRARELQPRYGLTKVSLDEAKQLLIEQHGKADGERLWAQAVDRARLFHDRDPAKTTHAYTYDDGQPGHQVKVVVGLGKVPETHYFTPWNSNKKGYHWIHHHPKGGEPLEVLDPVTGVTMKIGGTARVTDWWRK